MELFNNRYRIVRSLTQNQIVSSYVVSDLINKNQLIQLDIINSEFIPKDNLKYYIDEFITLSNINNPHIIKLYEFGLVTSIDGKNIKNTRFFLTKQYIETSHSFNKAISIITKDELLTQFASLCKTLNFMHLKGFIYKDLNPNNILVTLSKDKFQFVLKDLFTISLEKINTWKNIDTGFIFKAPEILSGLSPCVSSDIYSLGVILFSFYKNYYHPITLSKGLKKTNLTLINPSDKFLQNIHHLITKAIDESPNSRYENLWQVIDAINDLFHTNFKHFDQTLLEKLNFDNKIIGRSYEINKIITLYNCLEKRCLDKDVVLIHGQSGTGKTKLLKEVCRLLSFKNAHIYSSFNTNLNNSSFYPVIEILKKIISECDPELTRKYGNELVKIIPDLKNHKDIVASDFLRSDQENFRLLTKIFNFIYESIKNQPCVFLIDNLHLWDEFSIKLIEYLHIKTSSINNILFVFTYKGGNDPNINNKFFDFINNSKDALSTLNLNLNGLNKEETALFIEHTLGFPTIQTNFSEKIFVQTSGNPLFIQEIIKDLYLNNNIFIDKTTGTWDNMDLDQLPIPDSIEQASIHQIKDLDAISLKLLTILSVFYYPVPKEVLCSFLTDENLCIDQYLDQLISIGVLCSKIDDSGFLLDFSNKMLKNLIYSKLDKKKKVDFHKIVVNLLENQDYSQSLIKEDIIYHLEQANLKDKLLQYCIETSKKMEALKNTSITLSNLTKAISTFTSESKDETKLKLLMKIGEIHYKDGNYNDAISCYNEVVELTACEINLSNRIDAFNGLISVYLSKNNLNEVDRLFEASLSSLNRFHYEKGYLVSMYLLSLYYWIKLDFKKSIQIAKNALDKSSNNFPIEKANILRTLGNSYLSLNMPLDALDYLNEALKLLENTPATSDLLRIYNCIAAVYLESYQDINTAMDYYHRMNSLSKSNGFIQTEVVSTANLANIYLSKHEYEAAFEYAKIALEGALQINYERIVFYCYCLLVRICINICRFSDASYYLILLKKELTAFPDQSHFIDMYNNSLAHYYYMFGDIDQALIYTEKTICSTARIDCTEYWDSEILNQWCCINSNSSYKDLLKALEIILITLKHIYSPSEKMLYLVNTIFRLEDINNNSSTKIIEKLISEIENIHSTDLPGIIKANLQYCNSQYNKNTAKLLSLTESATAAKEQCNKILSYRIACALGEFYYLNKNYFYSINYYFEACELIKNLISQLPDEFKLPFVLNYKVLKPFNALNSFKHYSSFTSYILEPKNLYQNICFSDLESVLNYDNFKSILSNKEFLKSAKKIYSEGSTLKISTMNDLIGNLTSDPIKNIEIALNYLSSITFATYGAVIVESEISNYKILAATTTANVLLEKVNIIDKCQMLKEPILINNITESNNNYLANSDIKSLICIPIIMNLNDFVSSTNPIADTNYHEFIKIIGYLYLQSDRILNNFNKSSLKKCLNITKLIGCSIEKYTLKLSSSIDKLTGALTRKYIDQYIVDNIARSNVTTKPFSLLMLDVDYFKNVNDEFGHQVGDQVLSKISKIIIDSLGSDSYCGRYGGEEFIVVLPSVKADAALAIAEQIRIKVATEAQIGNKLITISTGVSSYPEHGQWKQDLIEKADQALYNAKQSGRNKSLIWKNSFSSNIQVRNKLSKIVSGNSIEDSRNLLILSELVNLLKNNDHPEKKLSLFLNKIICLSEAEVGIIMTVENEMIKKTYCQKSYEENKDEVKSCDDFNKSAVNSVIKSKNGIYLIDWDEVVGYDVLTGIPSWNSILISPVIMMGKVKGIIYLTSQAKQKEFSDKEFNIINIISPLLAPFLH